MSRPRSWLAPALFAALAGAQVGCSQVVCGDGTVEKDGACRPADEQPGAATCGLGTELGPGGTCVPSNPTECDEDTTMPELDPDTGITTCVGTTVDICTRELPCPAPSSGKLTLCGRLYDTETDDQIRAAGATGAMCNPASPTADGPCSLKVQFYDALVFQGDPTHASPLPPASLIVDDCGRYVAADVPMTSFGFIGAAVDDAGPGDTHLLTGAATSDALAVPAKGFRLYATRKSTEMAWTAAGMLGAGNSFVDFGVLLMVFRHAGAPVPGVVIEQSGNPVPANDYYFSDTGVSRSMVDRTRNMTGPDGSVLFLHADAPVQFTGVGGEPPGCRWPTALAATIPGVVFVQLKDAESTGGGPCP